MTTGCIYPVFHFVYCCILLCCFTSALQPLPVEVPDSWQLLAAAPEQKGALLAAWDGERTLAALALPVNFGGLRRF